MEKDEQTEQCTMLPLGFSDPVSGVNPGDCGESPPNLQSSCYLSDKDHVPYSVPADPPTSLPPPTPCPRSFL